MSSEDVDPFIHTVAIKLSRAENTINPNDLLAKRVIEIAKANARDAFVKGQSTHALSVLASHTPCSAAGSFGRFQQHFLEELHDDIHSHVKQQESGLVPRPVHGMNVIDSEVLAPEPQRQGGLVRPDTVSTQ